MLYLSRKVGESIVIDSNIEIVVTVISNKQVKLGIEAPRNSSVYRKELLEKIRKENQEAVESANWLISDSDSENVDKSFVNAASEINKAIGDALDELSNGSMPSILDITSRTGELLKEYSDYNVLKNEDVRFVLEAVCNNYKKLLTEMTKRYRVIDSEINLITNYLDKLNEAA